MDDYKLKRMMRIFAVRAAYAKYGSLITPTWVRTFFNMTSIEAEDYAKWKYNLKP